MLDGRTEEPFSILWQAVDRLPAEADAAFARRVDEVGTRLREKARQDHDRPRTRVLVRLDVGRNRAVVECRCYRPILR